MAQPEQQYQPRISPAGLALQIEAHWRQFRPSLYREYRQEGTLQQETLAEAERTFQMYEALRPVLPNHEAWEQAMREVALALPNP